MKYYKCDFCKDETISVPITLSGIKNPRHGGILLPAECAVSHFCTAKCFYHWAEELLVTDLVKSVLKRIGN